jgi:hypothetical protein
MSRNGSGTYTLPAGNPVVTSTTISSTWANNTLTDIATALTGSLAADGQTTATGNLKMGANRITGLADGIADTDAATVGQIPSGALFLLKASNLSDVANATTARGNLTAAKSGANSDITSITGLTTPLTVAQGGIGAATLTANNVLLGNGTSAPQTIAPSTTGNVLTSNGTTWVSSAPTQKIIQVLNTDYQTETSLTSGTYTEISGLSTAITPTSATSKVLFQGTLQVAHNPNTGAAFVIYRNSTLIGRDPFKWIFFSTVGDSGGTLAWSFLDSPATTSAVTYKVFWKCDNASFPIYLNRTSTNTANEKGSSQITLMEISA